MGDFSYLEPLSMTGYASLVTKISKFWEEHKDFPENIEDLSTDYSLTKNEKDVLEHRGVLERKLNDIQSNKIMLLRTFLEDKDNILVLARSGYILDGFKYNTNSEVGFLCINEDVKNRMGNRGQRNLRIAAGLAQIQGRKLKKIHSPNLNLYGIKELYVGEDEIIEQCKEQRINRKTLKKVKELISPETEYDLAQGAYTKIGLTSDKVNKILEGII